MALSLLPLQSGRDIGSAGVLLSEKHASGILQNQISSLLRHHQHRRMGVAAGDVRKDRSIDDPQPFQPVDFEVFVDH